MMVFIDPQGSRERVCQENGQWTGGVATCKSKSNDPWSPNDTKDTE